jgi:diaminopimelate decarboxylase
VLLGTQKINDKGHLEVGGCDTVDLVKHFGTPLYVMDEAAMREQCRAYRTAFESRYPQVEVCYAGKALLTTAICRIIDLEGMSLDVASPGEMYTALRADFPRERMYFHGNNKSAKDLEFAIEAGVGHIVADNLLEIVMIEDLARKFDQKVNILIRVTPGVDPHTHRFIRTGQSDTKFGLNIKSGDAMAGVKKALDASFIKLRGYHCHVGSQLLDFEPMVQGAQALVDFAADVQKETNFTPEVLNIGGGLGVRYLESHKTPSINDFAEAATTALKDAIKKQKLPTPLLLLEPGRSIVGEAGLTLYTVGSIKTVAISEKPGSRMYVAVDGGLSDNPRPTLYDAVYTVISANKANAPADTVVTIAGKHCETDILVRDTAIAKPETGDVLAVLTTGAYNYAMSSNYNRFIRPAMVLVNEGKADLIVEREILDDLVRHDRLPDRLQSLTKADNA